MSKDRTIAHNFEGEQLESVFVGRRDGQAREAQDVGVVEECGDVVEVLDRQRPQRDGHG